MNEKFQHTQLLPWTSIFGIFQAKSPSYRILQRKQSLFHSIALFTWTFKCTLKTHQIGYKLTNYDVLFNFFFLSFTCAPLYTLIFWGHMMCVKNFSLFLGSQFYFWILIHNFLMYGRLMRSTCVEICENFTNYSHNLVVKKFLLLQYKKKLLRTWNYARRSTLNAPLDAWAVYPFYERCF